MVRNKKELINKLNDLSENYIQQGLNFKALINSLKQHYKDKPLKEWKELVKVFIEGKNPLPKGDNNEKNKL